MTSGSNPFEGMPFFGDLMKMLGSQGPVQWDGARQLAISIATDGESEPNVDPIERLAYEQLSRVADLHVSQVSGLVTSTSGTLSIQPVARSRWVLATLDAFRPLVEELAAALKSGTDPGSTGAGASGLPTFPTGDDADGDPTEAWLGQIMGLLSPMLLGMTVGSLVGHLSTRSFGVYDLPIPRPAGDEILIIAPNVSSFAEDWSLDPDDLRLWVCLHQVAHHAVLRVPHVRARLDELILEHARAFESDPDGLGDQLSALDLDPTGGDPFAQFQEVMGSPEFLLGAVRSARQEELLPQIETLVGVIAAYVDHIMDRIGQGLLSSYQQVTEAMRRQRVEASPSDRFVERLLGLELTQDHYDRSRAFIDGVVDRAGDEALSRLWADPADLPTAQEIPLPGLWLARIGIDAFDEDLEIDLSGLDELLGSDGSENADGSDGPDGSDDPRA